MRKLILALLGAALLLTSASGGATPSGTAEFTRNLVGRTTIDIGEKNSTIGDVIVRRWRINTRAGTPVGTGHEICRWTGSDAAVCHGVYDLAEGSIAFIGVAGRGTFIVTGGTGRYLGASGSLNITGRSLAFHLA